jgi:long-chain acyl-CoA synthetase
MNTALFLAAAARVAPAAPAVSFDDCLVYRYGALATRVALLAAGLQDRLKLQRGARVALALPNRPEFVEIMWAAWFAGMTIAPINARLHVREMAYILANADAAVCFATADLAGSLSQTCNTGCHVIDVVSTEYDLLLATETMRPVELAGHEAAWIFYTSGTTGRPKGAVLSHRSLQAMTWRYYADVDHLSGTDTLLHTSALSHGSGLFSIPHIARGSHNVLMTRAPADDPAGTFDLINRYRNVSLVVSPALLQQLAEHPAAASARIDHIKTVLYGSAPIEPSLVKRALTVFGPRLWQGYGQGETPGTLTHLDQAAHCNVDHPHYEARLKSVGVARTGVEVGVVRADGTWADAGEVGEVVCRSDVTMTGYWLAPEATALALRDGWLRTGDLGAFDGDGYLSLTDRLKDLIISEGFKVYPREVEDVLRLHPDIRDVSVVGQTAPIVGEMIIAFVVARSSHTQPDGPALKRHCEAHLASFKCPSTFIYLDDLPRNAGGKVMKSELRNRTDDFQFT